MRIKFTKMHGLGNDFVVINAIKNPSVIDQFPFQKLSDRYQGIGFDQALFLTSSIVADVACRIFNSDGSEAEQCGNGMRCIARYIHENELIKGNIFKIETKGDIVRTLIKTYDQIEISIGCPIVTSADLMFQTLLNAMPTPIVLEHNLPITLVQLGNPHAILMISSIQETPIESWGAYISTHPYFPQGTNVGFMEKINQNRIVLRTYERGAGQTYSCGSNACAAVAAGIFKGKLCNPVSIDLTLGTLQVEWEGENEAIKLTGPASHIYEGEITLHLSDSDPF